MLIKGKVNMKKSLKYIMVSLFLIGFVVLLLNVRNHPILKIDGLINDFMLAIRTNGLTRLMKILTNLGSGIFLICLSILLVIFIKERKKSFAICLNLLFGFLLNYGLKFLTGRNRPLEPLIEVTGYSFPSGHSTASFTFYGFLIYLILKSNLSKKIKTIITTILVLIIITIMFSRIYLGAHFLTDIIGSILISIPYLIIFINVLKLKKV